MSTDNPEFIVPNADGSPTPIKLPTPPPEPVRRGSVTGNLLEELHELFSELGARRAFDADVGAFLNEKGLAEAFESYRKTRNH
jgi:hypothetical protein